jgi:hypothetical protein
MCRILFKQDNNALFDEKELEESYKYNPDGTGLIYFDASSNKTFIEK